MLADVRLVIPLLLHHILSAKLRAPEVAQCPDISDQDLLADSGTASLMGITCFEQLRLHHAALLVSTSQRG